MTSRRVSPSHRLPIVMGNRPAPDPRGRPLTTGYPTYLSTGRVPENPDIRRSP